MPVSITQPLRPAGDGKLKAGRKGSRRVQFWKPAHDSLARALYVRAAWCPPGEVEPQRTGQFAPFEQMSAEDFQAIVDTCFYGVVYTTRAAVPVMRKQKGGHIFQVSSTGGRRGVPGNTPYHAAKWAVGGFSDSLAMEVAPFGVKVCTLEPGGIRTNWARRAGQNAPDLLPEYEATVGSFLKILRGLEGRLEGDPRKIADVIVQLANSDEVPVRLILGEDAEKRVQQAEAARASEAQKWRHLTVSTIFDDGRFDGQLYMAKR
jgi:NAD(P)-dependent dehydrogenase (short-subunit alcohol dehydrogenase family)